ncbi:MAG: phage tail tape measure protein [Christensenellales bacterium]
MADGSIHIDTKLDSSGLESGLKNLGGIAAKGFAAVGAALSAAGGYAIKVGSDFEAAMSEVAAISGATGEDLQSLIDKAKEMGAKTKFSASESAEALKYMAMAGWDAKQMTDGLAGVMNLAAASGESLGAVSDIVTDAMTAFGMSANESGHFADVLAKAASTSNTNVGMMGETFKYVAPLAGALNYSIEDTAVAVGLMANSGIKASQAGTALRSILTRLAKPTKDSSAAMEALNISLTDSKGQMLPLSDVMGQMRKGFSGLTEEQKTAYAAMLGGQEAMSGLLAIVEASDEDFDKLTQSMVNSKNAAEDMANTMLDNLQGDIAIFKSATEGLGIAVYENLTAPMREATQAGTGMVESLSKALTEGGLNGLVAAVGSVLAQLVAQIAAVVPKVVQLATQLIQSFIIGLQSNAPAIAAAVVAIGLTLVQGILSVAPSFIQAGLSLLSNLGIGIANALPQLIASANACVVQIVSAFVSAAPQLLTAGAALISSLASGLAQAMPNVVQAAKSIVPKIAEGITSAIPKLASTAQSLMVNLGRFIEQNFPTLLKTGLEAVVKITGSVRDNAGKIVDGAIALAKALAKGLIDSIPTIIENVPTIVSNIANVINDNAPKIVKAGIELIGMLIKGLIQAIPTLIANIPKIISAVVDTLQAFNWINLGSMVVSKIASGLSGAVGVAKNAMSFVMNALKGGAGDIVNSFFSIGKNIVQGLWNGISSLTGWIGKKISGFAADMVSGFKALLGIHSPSRVMRDVIGKNMGLGVVSGLLGTTKQVEQASGKLADKATSVDLSSRMKSVVAERATVVGNDGGRSPDDRNGGGEGIDYDKLAKAVWREAPEMSLNCDGEKVATILEPKISEKQANKVTDKRRRRGT